MEILTEVVAKSEIGQVHPETLDEYRIRGGYQALLEALKMGPAAVIDAIQDADLRGRGGANFPTHIKWREVLKQDDPERYLVVNGAEGEPGAFKDRALMAKCPHAVLEGIYIAAWTIGAKEVVMYINNHFQDAIDALNGAYQEVRQFRDDPLGSALSIPVRLVPESHVYIAGEETALLSVLNGGPAQPTRKPPYPTSVGYRQKPTVVNNVETLAHVPVIFRRGVSWYRENRPTLFSVDGDVTHPGVYELNRGIPLHRLLETAGGPLPGQAIERVLPGGYSMPWISADRFDLAMDYDSLKEAGTGLGASVIALGSERSLHQVSKDILAFFTRETCGICPLCVRGTRLFHNLLKDPEQPLTPEEASQILAKSQKYAHAGLCTFLGTAVRMAEMSVPSITMASAETDRT